MINKMKNLIRGFIVGGSLIAVSAYALANEQSLPTKFVAQPFDVLRYDVVLDLTAAPKSDLKGICDITLKWTNRQDTDKFFFHLTDLQIDSAFYNGTRFTPQSFGDKYAADFRYEVTPTDNKDTAVVKIYYAGTATAEPGSSQWGGVQNDGTILYSMGVGFHNDYISCMRHWIPCYDHPSDKAKFDITYVVKPNMVVAGTGVLTYAEAQTGNHIYKWTENKECATYLNAFAVAPYKIININTPDYPIQIFTLAKDSVASAFAYQNVPKMVATFEKRFGKYPFEKVGYCNTPIGSMEHQTMISLDQEVIRDAYKNKDTNNSTIAHELSHQLFGDWISPEDFRNAWLNESFATFCESIWAEELGGNTAYLSKIQYDIDLYFNYIVNTEKILSLYDFSRVNPSSNYPMTIYYKGAAVVSLLRYELGDEKFFAALKEYLATYAYSHANTQQLKAILEKHYGQTLDWFFNQWVYGKGYPKIDISINTPLNSTNKTLNIKLKQVQNTAYGTYINLPIELAFKQTDGTFKYKIVKMTQAEQSFDIDDVTPATKISFNQGPTVRTLLLAGKTTGIEDQTSEDAFTVSPNPSGGVFDINLIQSEESYTLDVFDAMGAKVVSRTIPASSENFRLNLTELPSGAYFVKIYNSAHSTTMNLVKE